MRKRTDVSGGACPRVAWLAQPLAALRTLPIIVVAISVLLASSHRAHGDRDKLVRIDHSHKILKAFQQQGVTCKLLTIEGAGHGFRGEDKRRATQEMVGWFEKFLEKRRED